MRGGFFWRALLTGSLRVLVRTRRQSAVISALVAAGVPLWNVIRTPEGFSATFPAERRRVFYATLHRFPARARVVRRAGLLRWLGRLPRRPALLAGVLVAALLVANFTARVYVVDVPGASTRLEERVLQAASDAGVRPGARRSGIDAAAVEREILAAVPGLSWVGVNVYGGLVLIRVHELIPPIARRYAPRLVAARAGTVRSVAVYAGQAVVAPGDTVRRGQELIVGAVVVPPGRYARGDTPAVEVAAGTVLAAVTLNVRETVPLRQHYEILTGRWRSRTWIRVGNWSVTSGLGPVPFADYATVTRSQRLVWRGVRLPAYQVTVVYNEAIIKARRLSLTEAREMAEARGLIKLSRAFRPGARVIQERIGVTTAKGAVTVDIEAVVEENIAEAKRPAGGGT